MHVNKVKSFAIFESMNDLSKDQVEHMFKLNLITSETYYQWLMTNNEIRFDNTAIVDHRNVNGCLNIKIGFKNQNYIIVLNSYFNSWNWAADNNNKIKDIGFKKCREIGAEFVFIKVHELLYDVETEKLLSDNSTGPVTNPNDYKIPE